MILNVACFVLYSVNVTRTTGENMMSLFSPPLEQPFLNSLRFQPILRFSKLLDWNENEYTFHFRIKFNIGEILITLDKCYWFFFFFFAKYLQIDQVIPSLTISRELSLGQGIVLHYPHARGWLGQIWPNNIFLFFYRNEHFYPILLLIS